MTTPEVLAGARAHLARLEAYAEALRSLAGHAQDADDAVRATVDGSGALVELHLGPAAARLGAERLGAVVCAVVAAAARDVQQQHSRLQGSWWPKSPPGA